MSIENLIYGVFERWREKTKISVPILLVMNAFSNSMDLEINKIQIFRGIGLQYHNLIQLNI